MQLGKIILVADAASRTGEDLSLAQPLAAITSDLALLMEHHRVLATRSGKARTAGDGGGGAAASAVAGCGRCSSAPRTAD